MKDTDKNRQLQRELAEKSQLQIGAYLYRKERKKRKGSNSTNAVEAKFPFRPSSDGSSCCSTTPGSAVQEEIPENISSRIDCFLFNINIIIHSQSSFYESHSQSNNGNRRVV